LWAAAAGGERRRSRAVAEVGGFPGFGVGEASMACGFRGMAVGGGRLGGGGGVWAARPAAMAPPVGRWWTTGGQGWRRGREMEADREEGSGEGGGRV